MPDESTPVDNSDDDDLLSPTPPFAPNFDPATWRDVCESFIDALIEELERWLQRRPPADSGTDITDWLVELTYTLYPVALGVGTDESLKRWSRAKVELEACISLDFADRFEAQIKDMFKATEAVIAEFSQCAPKHESAVIEPFLCVSVEGFLTYLNSCSATLRNQLRLLPPTPPAPSDTEKSADHHPPCDAEIKTQELDDKTCEPSSESGSTSAADGADYAEDFRSVYWYGESFQFTPMQAKCVQILWDNWLGRTPAVGEGTILEFAGSDGNRLRDVFKKGEHPAWGKMIVPSGKGAFRLQEPGEKRA